MTHRVEVLRSSVAGAAGGRYGAVAMSHVQRLSDALANQIAAGEVVERPASVVKELVENALDAGAGRVEVRLEDGGRKRVEVLDDGAGMDRADALLALDRHTTSKLHTSDDLFAIRTFGFRGEALPSIASVSRLTLTTRTREALAATRLVVEGGRVLEAGEVGAPVGTRFDVADLFFNVPARLKFLKQRATELGHVTDWLTRLALARPEVSLLVTEGTRTILRADASGDMRERIAALLGRELHEALYEVEGAAGDVRVHGWAAGPQRANNTAREVFTFVNRRFVRDRGLMHAVARAYEGVLPIGRSPACVLFIELPPDRVDVNVHPQKLEVRFADPRSVYDATAKAVAFTLAQSPWLVRPKPAAPADRPRPSPTASEPAPTPAPAPSATPTRSYALRPVEPAPDRPAGTPLPLPLGFSARQQRVADAIDRFVERNEHRLEVQGATLSIDRPLTARDAVGAALPAVPEPAPTSGAAGDRLVFGELRYLGQVHRTYLVCESPQGLVLLDQHAAHERVLYERLRAERAGCAQKGQPLLVPMTLELAPGDARLVEAALEELSDLGFEVEPFGGQTFSLKAAPAELGTADLRRVVVELAQEVRTFGRATSAEALEESLLARLACHSAVRAGHPLGPEEARALLEQLDGTPFHAQCPHGRPVAVRFDVSRLEELFGRTYEGTPKAAARDRLMR